MANMPCIHGKVCREYMETFGLVRKRGEPWADVQMCIISTKCPLCKFYEPAVEAAYGLRRGTWNYCPNCGARVVEE